MPINGLHAISQSQNTPLSGWRSVCFCKGPTKHLWGILHFTFNRQMSVLSSEIDCDVYDWNVNVKCDFFSVSPIQLNGKNDCLLFSINVRVPVVLTFFRKLPLQRCLFTGDIFTLKRSFNITGSKNCEFLFHPNRQSIRRILAVTHTD